MVDLRPVIALCVILAPMAASEAQTSRPEVERVIVIALDDRSGKDAADERPPIAAPASAPSRVRTIVDGNGETCAPNWAARVAIRIGRDCPDHPAGFARAPVIAISAQSAQQAPPLEVHQFALAITQLTGQTAFAMAMQTELRASDRVVLISDRTALARSLRVAARGSVNAANVVLDLDFQAGARDYRALAARIVATEPTLVAVAAFPTEAAIIVRELRQALPAVRIIAPYLLASPTFQSLAGAASEDVRVAMPTSRDAERIAAESIARQTLETITSLTPDAVIHHLRSATFDTPSGRVKFDDARQAVLNRPAVVRWRSGTLMWEQSPSR